MEIVRSLDPASVLCGVLATAFVGIIGKFVTDARTTAQRTPVLAHASPESGAAFEWVPQHPFAFFEAAIVNMIYKHRIFGVHTCFTHWISRLARHNFNAFREPCSTKKIRAWAAKHGIAEKGWEKPIEEYESIDAFFTRRYAGGPVHGTAVTPRPLHATSPAEGTVMGFSSVARMQELLVKQKRFSLASAGVPTEFLEELEGGSAFVFKLDVDNMHRFFAPCSGRIAARVDHLEPLRASHSIRPMSLKGGWRILTENRRVVLVVESPTIGNVAMMIVGGIAVDSVEVKESVRVGSKVEQGEELGTFHLGGSAVVLFLPRGQLKVRPEIEVASLCGAEFVVRVGDVVTQLRHGSNSRVGGTEPEGVAVGAAEIAPAVSGQ
jgi:phosphatidylserine decarboxylase